ncbi:mycofactocin biosynthesis glycosyltransferase MftF [Streptomyces sp. PSKA54]|uniref:Mycofactocin biosynthesis glycosyltransferase MftF n=1 Tax=Streptomyces himalayensis subsp. aureolus TaxID=2758039 RepID=A0A7W2HH98_9ACTN|nr:mycofactocin biosynthesis glycosyltransferase MftF [Streptomyces himalayensis]MBA4863564.1 mycofactocin biosynthesis glycosyltransferase MftF [Streptomyces himalayensis subsp. aureolus]
MTLPHGFVVTLDRHTRVLDDGRAILGGNPTRLLRLSARARPLLSGRTVRVRDAASALLADRLLETGLANPVVEALPPHPASGNGGDPDPDCTYVIPVRDRPQELARLLASIPAGSPVIVVDDASRRLGLVAAVAAEHGARLVSLTVNLGPAGARNAGLRLVTTPYVAFVDSDIVLSPDMVPTLLRHFADPRVAMAVPRITGLATSESSRWLGRYESTRSSLDLGAHPAAVRPGTPVSWAPSACAVARVDVLTDGGGFDERMRVGEDVDLCWRLVRDGWRIRYEPVAEAAHEHRVGLGDWFQRKAVYGTGAHPLAERHPESIAPAVLAPWSTALVLTLLAQRRWSLPVAGSVWAVATARIAGKLTSTEHPVRLAARLSADGAVSALAQGSALLTRHWWPLTAIGCLASRRIRRATALAAVTDIALEYRGGTNRLDPVRYGIARRLDDLAYGAGVWISALRGRSTAALRPRIVMTRRAPQRQPTTTALPSLGDTTVTGQQPARPATPRRARR